MATATFSYKNIANVLNVPCGAASTSKTIDVYKKVKFETKLVNEVLNVKCTGNNGNCEVVSFDSAISGDEICFLVDGQKFKSLISSYNKDAPITLSVKGENVMVTQGKTKHKLPLTDVTTYPDYPKELSGDKTEVQAQTTEFLYALERVLFASADKNKGESQLSSINIQVADGSLQFTATNRHLFSQYRIPVSVNGSIDRDVTIHKEVALQWLSMRSKADVMKMTFTNHRINLMVGYNSITSTLMDSKFPLAQLSKVIPEKFKSEVTFKTHTIRSAMTRISIASEDKSECTVIRLKTNKRSVNLSNAKCGAESQESFSAKCNNEDELEIGYSLSLFNNVIAQVQGDEFTLMFNGSNSLSKIIDHSNKIQPMMIMPCNL
jgi:DNA polymerase III sliding clamp (beta) subunit (PCNA family)